MKDHYVYPAIFHYDTDGITVDFPDFPGCMTCADDAQEALKNAKETLAVNLITLEEDHEPIPEPRDVSDLQTGSGKVAVLVDVWMPYYRDAAENKAINKMVTLPKWMADAGKQQGVNFSQLLQHALMEFLVGGEKRP